MVMAVQSPPRLMAMQLEAITSILTTVKDAPNGVTGVLVRTYHDEEFVSESVLSVETGLAWYRQCCLGGTQVMANWITES